MNTKVKSFLSVLTVVSILSINADGFAKTKSGNGDSYSGPTLKGDAIAVNADKSLTGEQIIKVLEDCISPEGKENIFIQALRPIIKTTGELKIKSSVKIELSSTLPFVDFTYAIGEDANSNFLSEAINGHLNTGVKLVHFYDKSRESGYRRFRVGSLPWISYVKKEVKIYNRLTGDLEKKYDVFENVKVVYDFKKANPFPQMTNVETEQSTELTFPAAELAQCYVDALGRL